MSVKFRIILFLCVLVLAVAIRVAHYKWDLYDSDEAIVGLMAMNIISGEHLPVFNYGYPKLGSLEAYVTAVMFKVFGISVLSHRMALLVFAILYFAGIYVLAFRLFRNRNIAFLSLCFVLVCPSYLVFWNFAGRAVYIESLALGTWMFVGVHQAIWKGEERNVFYLLLGILTGLAWWTGGLILYYILTAALFFFLKDKLIIFRRKFWVLVSGFFVGSMPFWIYQLRMDFGSMLFYSPEQNRFSLRVLIDFMRHGIPYVLSVGPVALPKGLLCNLSSLMELAFFAAFLVLVWKCRKGLLSIFKLSTKGTEGPELILVFLVVVTVIFSFSRYGGGNYRVLLPLYTAIPILFAFLVVHVLERSKFAAIMVALIVIIFSLSSNIFYAKNALAQGDSRRDRQGLPPVDGLAEHLLGAGISKCYAGSYLALKLAVASKGQVISAAPYDYRYPPHEEIINAEPDPVFVLRAWQKRFAEMLKTVCNTFDVKRHKGFAIFSNFERPNEVLSEISPGLWQATASSDVESTHFAYDRNVCTKWTPGRSQQAGEYFELDLGEINKLRKLVIIIGSSKKTTREEFEFPLGFDLELSKDREDWEKVFHLPEYGAIGSLFWSDCRPFWKPWDGRMELFLPEVIEARYVRLTLIKDHPAYGWAIDEIFVYSASEGDTQAKEVRGSHEKVLEFLTRQSIDKVYAGYWLSSWIHLSSGEAIDYIPPYNGMKYPRTDNAGQIVDYEKDIAFVVEEENGASLEKAFDEYGISCKRREIGKYLVYHSLERLVYEQGVKLGTEDWSAITSNPGMEADKAFDGDPAIRWGTGAPQRSGMFYELDLGSNYILTRVSFDLGKFPHDYPRGYRVEVSIDGEKWVKLRAKDVWGGEVFWTGKHLLRYQEAGPGIDVRCKPTLARYIRVSLTSSHKHFDWSVTEISVWAGRQLR